MQISVIRKERKYSFSIPFWVLIAEEVSVWMVEVTFGMVFSNHTRSSMVRAVLKLALRDFSGSNRCTIVGK